MVFDNVALAVILLVMMSPEIALEHLKHGPKDCLYVSDKEEAAKKAAKVHILNNCLPYALRQELLEAFSTFRYREGGYDAMEHDESV